MTDTFDREQVLAHRAAVQDLAGPVADAGECRLLGLGMQDTPAGSGLLALGARIDRSATAWPATDQPAGDPAAAKLLAPGGPLAVVMAARGAPHLVARAELPRLRAALVPPDDREADEVEEVALAMRDVADGGAISRPDLSGALNDLVDDGLRTWCERCRSRHVREELFRKATLQAGLELDPSATSPTTFRPFAADGTAQPDRDHARAELVRRYVHLTGVARPADLAAWLGYRPGEVRATWNLIADELTPCTVAGTRRWALTRDVASLSDAPPPRGATLLPPSDPFLLGDRALVVPDRQRQRRVWRAQASPGVILVDGAVAGTWRRRIRGRRLHVTLHPFRTLGSTAVKELTAGAERVGALRGIAPDDLDVTVAPPE